jgi:IclR family transcriptional regulator, pca regulon regulatory protein
MSDAVAGDRQFVQSLERGLSVIGALSAPGPGLTVADVARRTTLTRAAARRFLLTLEHLGYVRSNARLFTLTPRVLELGYAYLSALSLPDIAQPHLEQLVERVSESSSVSVLDGTDVVYVARMPVGRIMAASINVGTRFPAALTSMGRVLLAELPAAQRRAALDAAARPDLEQALDAVARQGWALVDQELEQGLRSIAAPIRNLDGDVVAAVNLSTHASRTTIDELRRRLLPALLETAAAIERDLAAAAR